MILFVTTMNVGDVERTFISGMLDTYSSIPKYVNLNELLCVPKYHNILCMFDKGTINYEAVDDIILPIVEHYDPDDASFDIEEILYLSDPYDIGSLGDMVLFDNDFSEVDSLLESIVPAYSSKEFQGMCLASADCIKSIVDYKFRYNLNRKVDIDIRAVADRYNSESKVTGVTTTRMNSTNITQPMDTCEAELFIKLPKPYYIVGMDSTSDDEYLSMDFASIDEVYTALNPYKDNEDARDNGNYKEAIQELGVEAIMGNPANNYLPIQNNEKRFYNAIVRYIERSLKIYLEAEGIFSEDEFNRRLRCNVLPVHLELILKSYIKAFVNVNWSHSSNVPSNEFTPSADSDDDDENSGGDKSESAIAHDYIVSGGVDKYKKGDITHYLISIENLLKSGVTAYAWAEVIVKLARWGSRKPTHLKFTEEESGSSNVMLDLFKFEAEEDLSYLDDYECIELDGCKYVIASLIVNDSMDIADSTGLVDALGLETHGDSSVCSAGVVGIRCVQSFDTSVGLKKVNVYFSLESIIDNYKQGTNLIYGLSYINDEFVIDTDVLSQLGSSMKVTDVITLVSEKPNKNKLIMSPEVFKQLQNYKDFSIGSVCNYSLFGFICNIVPETDLTNLFSCEESKSSSVINYLKCTFKCNMEYLFLPRTDKGTLETALNIYNLMYKDVNFSVDTNLSVQSHNDMNITDLFGAEPKISTILLEPVYCLKFTKFEFFICKLAEQDSNGCTKVLTHNKDLVDLSKPYQTVKDVGAIRNSSIIAYMNMCKNYKEGVYASQETIDELDGALQSAVKGGIKDVINKLKK